jgi:hypothetical protein
MSDFKIGEKVIIKCYGSTYHIVEVYKDYVKVKDGDKVSAWGTFSKASIEHVLKHKLDKILR